MERFLNLLNSYTGRDSIIRATSYFSLYLSSETSGNTSLKFRKISEELSYCRVILRLFDDLPMLRHSLSYGFGKEEKGFFLRLLGVVQNIFDQIYYPVEHIAWAADKRLIKAESGIFSMAGIVLWAASCYISIARSVMMMSHLQRKTHGLKNVTIHENIVKEQLELLLLAFKNVADLVIAINYFPPGSLLWAGKLNTKQVGVWGIVSSFLRILTIARSMKKKEGSVTK